MSERNIIRHWGEKKQIKEAHGFKQLFLELRLSRAEAARTNTKDFVSLAAMMPPMCCKIGYIA